MGTTRDEMSVYISVCQSVSLIVSVFVCLLIRIREQRCSSTREKASLSLSCDFTPSKFRWTRKRRVRLARTWKCRRGIPVLEAPIRTNAFHEDMRCGHLSNNCLGTSLGLDWLEVEFLLLLFDRKRCHYWHATDATTATSHHRITAICLSSSKFPTSCGLGTSGIERNNNEHACCDLFE